MKKMISSLMVLVFLLSACGGSVNQQAKSDTENQVEKKQEGEKTKTMEKADKKTTQEDQLKNDGLKAPEFSLLNKKGDTVSLDDLKGKKVYIKFWASWCSACLAGLEDLNQLAGEDHDFEVYTIVAPGLNGEMEREDFVEWIDDLEMVNIPVLFDPEGELMREYGIRAFPSSAYIGSDGILVKMVVGPKNNDEIIEEMEKIK